LWHQSVNFDIRSIVKNKRTTTFGTCAQTLRISRSSCLAHVRLLNTDRYLQNFHHGQEARIEVRDCIRYRTDRIANIQGTAVATRRGAVTSSLFAAPTAQDVHPKTRRSRDSPSAIWSSRPLSVRGKALKALKAIHDADCF